jgi:hypothetical protein
VNPLEKAFAKSLQNYLNFPEQKSLVEEYYGKGTKIVISQVVLSGNIKKTQVTSKVVLGDVISESSLDTSMALVLIGECLNYLNPNSEYQVFVYFDS